MNERPESRIDIPPVIGVEGRTGVPPVIGVESRTGVSPVIGVEIGGSKLQAALGTREGKIIHLASERAKPEAGAEGIRAQIESLVQRLLEEGEEMCRRDARATLRPASIGVGFGGPVDSAQGRTLVSHQVEGWEDFPLRQWFEEKFNLPARVENDSNAAGWAEYCCGAGYGVRHMIYMNIGSGIGGAIILNGALHNGQGLGAGEIGHTYIPNLWPLASGERLFDKVEHLCSGWSVERRIRQVDRIPHGSPLHDMTEGRPNRITGPVIAEAAERGDRLVLDSLDRVAEMLGLTIANLITVFHPERCVVGGGFAQLGAPLFDRLRASVEQYVFAPFRGRYEILPAQLEQNVVLVGALLLAP